MKVTLVTCFNADWHFGRLPRPYVPLNLLCLAASLRERGHAVEIVDQIAMFPEPPNVRREHRKLVVKSDRPILEQSPIEAIKVVSMKNCHICLNLAAERLRLFAGIRIICRARAFACDAR